MAVLVIGGAGFIGSHLVDDLLVAGSEVLVVDDLSTGKLENLSRWKGNDRLDFVKLKAEHDLARILDHKNWVFVCAPMDLHELQHKSKDAEVRRIICNVGSLDGELDDRMVRFYSRGVYGPRGPDNGDLFVSDLVRLNIMAAMDYSVSGKIEVTPHGGLDPSAESVFGWKPLVDQGQGKYIIEMYKKVNEGSSLIIVSR